MRNRTSSYDTLLSFCICTLFPLAAFIFVYHTVVYFYDSLNRVHLCITLLTLEYVTGYFFIHLYDGRYWSIYCNFKSLNIFNKLSENVISITSKLKQAMIKIGFAKADNQRLSLTLVESDSDSDCIYECNCSIKCDNIITWNDIFE